MDAIHGSLGFRVERGTFYLTQMGWGGGRVTIVAWVRHRVHSSLPMLTMYPPISSPARLLG